jgi:hypothetical protein
VWSSGGAAGAIVDDHVVRDADPISPELALVSDELRRRAILELDASLGGPPDVVQAPPEVIVASNAWPPAETSGPGLRPSILPEYGSARGSRRRGVASMTLAVTLYALAALVRAVIVMSVLLAILGVAVGLAVAAGR